MTLMLGISLSYTSCKSDSSTTQPKATVPTKISGANYDWIHLAVYTIEYGDFIRDRSFRSEPNVANKVKGKMGRI
jgi:hypothetical protein